MLLSLSLSDPVSLSSDKLEELISAIENGRHFGSSDWTQGYWHHPSWVDIAKLPPRPQPVKPRDATLELIASNVMATVPDQIGEHTHEDIEKIVRHALTVLMKS